MSKMTTQAKPLSTTSYFGFVTVALEWLAALILVLLYPLNTTEPFSQFGYYDETKLVFGAFFTVAAAIYYLFSRHLNRYWRYTSLSALVAGAAFAVTGWAPYEPYADTFVLDVHNVALVIAIFCYTLPMLCIAYAKKHEVVAAFSRTAYIAITSIVLLSLIARTLSWGVLYSQLFTVLAFHIWVVVINYYLLQHEQAHDHSSKI